ncbi:MAG: hypothetical protein U0326_16995 [Polyangiales bacterium]
MYTATTGAHPIAALRAIARSEALSPEYAGGLTDHAAMAVEALERLDPDAIDAFVAAYFPRLHSLDEERDPTLATFRADSEAQRAALDREGLRPLLAARCDAALGAGLVGAAFHGALRVAHAARALARGDHPVYRAELGRALAYAALRAEALPSLPDAPSGPALTLDEALAALEPSPDAGTHVPGMITATLLARARAHRTLGPVTARVRLDDDPARAAHALREGAVRLLTDGEYHAANHFTLLHGVTGMDAVCALVALLPRASAASLLRHATHALLAVRGAYVGALREAPARSPASDFATLRRRAVETLNDHSIKLAAALLEAEQVESTERHALALEGWLRGRSA